MNDTQATPPKQDSIDADAPRFGPGARALIVAAFVLVIGAVYLAFTSGGDDQSQTMMTSSPYANAEKVEVSEVSGLPEEVGHAVFWAGEKGGDPVGVSSDEAGNVHLRYLPEDAEADDPEPAYLDIGSYPYPGALNATAGLLKDKGNVRVDIPGAVAVQPKSRPTSVIIAFRKDPDVQVEVFHPDPEKALAFAKSGAIVPVP
jgi:hypothetical protein